MSDDEGVSTIVGAILLLALLVTVFVTIRSSFVPNWEAQAESAHANRIEQQLGGLKGALDFQSVSRPFTSLAHPLSMATERTSVFSRTDPPDSVRFEPASVNVSVAAPEAILQITDDRGFDTVAESWRTVSGTTTVSNIQDIRNFRLRVDRIRAADNGDTIRVNVRDKDGLPAGNFTLSVENSNGPDYYIWYTVRDATNAIRYRQPDVYFNSAEFSPFFTDLLTPQYRFNSVLRSTSTPYSVQIVENGLTSSFSMTYLGVTGTGENVWVGGGSREVTNYLQSYLGGHLTYVADRSATEDQSWTVENGALVLAQRDGAVFRIPPDVKVNRIAQVTHVSLGLPSLTGPAAHYTTGQTVTIHTRTLAQQSVTALAPEFTLAIPNRHPTLWRAFLTEQLTGAGLREGPDFQFPPTGQTSSLTTLLLRGTGPPSADDVQLALVQSHIDVRIVP